MLAKLWKKVLLAICILACLFNITYKFVNRHSLEANLKRANDGTTVIDSIKKEKAEVPTNYSSGKEDDEKDNQNTVENIENDLEEESYLNSTNTQKDNNHIENNENYKNEESETSKENIFDFNKTQPLVEEPKDGVFKYSDFTVIF